MLDLYRVIWKATGTGQIVLIFLSLGAAALAALPIDYQKRFINRMGEGGTFDELVTLGIGLAGVILLSQALKWALAYRAGVVGEGASRLIRRRAHERAIENENAPSRNVGALANIVSAEAETVGQFVGSAVSEPLLNIGTLISVIGYIAVTSPGLGIIIACIIIPQALLVAFTQKQVNTLVHERVVTLRRAVQTLARPDYVSAASQTSEDFDRIFETRRRIFLWKLSTKFILNILNGAGLIVVLVYGGWLVTRGTTDVGTVVAATVALSGIQQPWRALIAFFRTLSVVHVQFELLRDAERTSAPAANASR
jgi:ABC-type bacteriocin/lantibiotic exporter with double-glycine peptidase domain